MPSVSNRETDIMMRCKLDSCGHVNLFRHVHGIGIVSANDTSISSGQEGIAALVGKERGHHRCWIVVAGKAQQRCIGDAATLGSYCIGGSSHPSCKILHAPASYGVDWSSWQGLARGTVAMSLPPREWLKAANCWVEGQHVSPG